MITIRLAKREDAADIKHLNDLFNGKDSNTLPRITESLQDNDRELVYVAVVAGATVGFCCAIIIKSLCYSAAYAEITELFVTKQYRRQGIGEQLLKTMEKTLIEAGVIHIHIHTAADNKQAQGLYQHCGYRVTDELLLDKDC